MNRYLGRLSDKQKMEREKFLEQSKEGCPFCDLTTRKNDIVIKTPNFIALIDKAPATDQYYVVFPKKHMLSYYEVPEEEGIEVDEIIKRLKEKTGRENVVLFENGAGNKRDGDCGVISHQSVYHSHLNTVLLPDGMEVMSEIKQRFFDNKVPMWELEPDGFNHIKAAQELTDGKAYFYVRQGRSAFLAIEEEKVIPSQFVRRTVADVFNNHQTSAFWAWKNIKKEYQLEIEMRKETMRQLFW